MEPTDRPRNPYRPGDVVTYVQRDGTGEGTLWAVHGVANDQVYLKPALSFTGTHVKHRARVWWWDLRPTNDLVSLGRSYMLLGSIIQDAARRLSVCPAGVPSDGEHRPQGSV